MVLDRLVLELMEKETLNREQIAAVFHDVVKRPSRKVWLSSDRRTVSDQPPVQAPPRPHLNGSTAATLNGGAAHGSPVRGGSAATEAPGADPSGDDARA